MNGERPNRGSEPEQKIRAGGYSTSKKIPKMKSPPRGPAPGAKPPSDKKSR